MMGKILEKIEKVGITIFFGGGRTWGDLGKSVYQRNPKHTTSTIKNYQ